jgi:hypothetical protein
VSSEPSSVTVFVVCGRDSQAYAQHAEALAVRLREHGIDAKLDQSADDLPQAGECDFVLIVCTPTSQGTMLAEHLIHEAQARNETIVPVLFEQGTEQDVPMVLQAYTRYRLPGDYDRLLRRLTGQPAMVPPPLETVRVMPPTARPGSESWGEQIMAAQTASDFEAREATDRVWLLEPRSDIGLDDHHWDTGAAAALDVLARNIPATTRGSTLVVRGRVHHKQRPVALCPDCGGALQPAIVSVRFTLAPEATATQHVLGHRCIACESEWPEPSAMRSAHADAFVLS